MKKIMIWATMLLTLCACQNNNNTTTEAEELPLPETIEEFVERLDSMDSFFEHTMNSDSTTTSYYRYWGRYHTKNFENDSVREREMAIRNYFSKGIKHLQEKYRPKAAKYYDYETHINGKDTIEFVLATKALSDSLPDDMKGKEFSTNYRYYPEFITYNFQKKNEDVWEMFTYHKEEKTPLKQLAHKEDVQQLVLNLISSVKGVKEIPVKYLNENGERFNGNIICFDWQKKGEKTALQEGTLYEIPVKGEEKMKLVNDLCNALTDFVKTHYAPYLEYTFYDRFDKEDSDRYRTNIMGLNINNTEGAGHAAMRAGLFRLQVGGYGDQSLKILFLNVRNQSFYIPMDWMEIKQIHNNDIEWLPGSKYHM